MQEEFCPSAAAQAAGKPHFFLAIEKIGPYCEEVSLEEKKFPPPVVVAGECSERT
jgi:hypothetical protein